MKRTMLQTMFLVGLGAGLGYLAEAGGLDVPRLAAGEPGSRSSGPSAFTEATPAVQREPPEAASCRWPRPQSFRGRPQPSRAGRSPTSSSSGETTSGSRTSAPTRWG